MSKSVPQDHPLYVILENLYARGFSRSQTIPSVCQLVSEFLVEKLKIDEDNWVKKTSISTISQDSEIKVLWSNGRLSGEPKFYAKMLGYYSYRKKLFSAKIINPTYQHPEEIEVRDRDGEPINLTSLIKEFQNIRHTNSHRTDDELVFTDWILSALYIMEDIMTICDKTATRTMELIRGAQGIVEAFNKGTVGELLNKYEALKSRRFEIIHKAKELAQAEIDATEKAVRLSQLKHEHKRMQESFARFSLQMAKALNERSGKSIASATQPIRYSVVKYHQDDISTAIKLFNEELLNRSSQEIQTISSPGSALGLRTTFPALTDDEVIQLEKTEQNLSDLEEEYNKVMDELLNQPEKKKRPVVVPLVSYGITQFQKRAIVVGIAVCGMLGVMYASGLFSILFQPTQQPVPTALDTGKKDSTKKKIEFDPAKHRDSITRALAKNPNYNGNAPESARDGKPQHQPSAQMKTQVPFKPKRLMYITVLTKTTSAAQYLANSVIQPGDRIRCGSDSIDVDSRSINSIQSKLENWIKRIKPYHHSSTWSKMFESLDQAEEHSKKLGNPTSGLGIPYAVYFINAMSKDDLNPFTDDTGKPDPYPQKLRKRLEELQNSNIEIRWLIKEGNTYNEPPKFSEKNNKLTQYIFKRVL